MFKSIKHLFGINDTWSDIVKEINLQKDIIQDVNKILVDEKDEASNIIKQATINQAFGNIEALSFSLNKFLKPYHNSELNIAGISKYLEREIPKECNGFVFRVHKKYMSDPDITKFMNIYGIESIETDLLKNISKYITFWEKSKFNKKFQKLYAFGIFKKIVTEFEKFDKSGSKYIQDNFEIKFYNKLTALNDLNEIIKIIHFQIITHLRNQSMSHRTLPIIVVNNVSWRNKLLHVIENCDNFKAVVLTEKN